MENQARQVKPCIRVSGRKLTLEQNPLHNVANFQFQLMAPG